MVELKKFGFKEEVAEIQRDYYGKTGFPQSLKKYKVVLEAYNLSVEETYFFILKQARLDNGLAEVTKITDIFTASEQSSYFGAATQRLMNLQEKTSGYIGLLTKMVKDMFQMIREIRMLDERLTYYVQSEAGHEGSEITLKGYWIDLVDGGSKNPSSVYGLAAQVGFTILPDLFFSTHPKTLADVDAVVNALKFNRKIREVLSRKLTSYIAWKDNTFKELKTRKIFMCKSLRQHYNVMRMYSSWVKPFLKNIRRMQMNQDKTKSPDLIGAFEGSIVEIEFLAKRRIANNYYAVAVATFEFFSMPEMNYSAEWQRGPLHKGRVEVELRAYAWTKEEVENYVKMRESEDMELLGLADESVKAAIEALGDDLDKYLKEAEMKEGLNRKVEEKVKPKKPNMVMGVAGPFIGVFSGMYELLDALTGVSSFFQNTGKKENLVAKKNEQKTAGGIAMGALWQMFKNYKKAHGMFAW